MNKEGQLFFVFAPIAIVLWVILCVHALTDAGAPYQCGSDTECELLHGRNE
jgi:hypothetical protein